MTLHVYYGALCVSMAAVGPMALCGRYGALRLSDSLWPLWRSVAAMGRCVSMAAMALCGRYGALCLPDSLSIRYGALCISMAAMIAMTPRVRYGAQCPYGRGAAVSVRARR